MSFPFPIVEKIKWVYPINIASAPNKLVETKLSEIDNESQLTSLVSFTQIYSQKHSSLKLEYERNISAIEKSLIERIESMKPIIRDWKPNIKICINMLSSYQSH